MNSEQRRIHLEELESMVPLALAGIRCIIGPKPPRNAQSLLAAALAILNRTGFPAQTESKVIGDASQPLQSKLVVEFVRARPVIEAQVVKELDEVCDSYERGKPGSKGK